MRISIVDGGAQPAPSEVRRGVLEVLSAAGRELSIGAGEVTVRFVDADEMQSLNQAWRGKRAPTDVLSFPSGLVAPDGRRHVGDIALCLPVAKRQAVRRRHRTEREVMLLALHGLLHLLGYDHERDDGEMERLERRLRRDLLPPRGRS